MIFKQLLLASLCVLSAFGNDSIAAPTLYPKEKEAYKNFENTTTSPVIGDTIDSSRAYVLPANSGVATIVEQRLGSANLGFCPEMSHLQAASLSRVEQINRHQAQLDEMSADLKQKEKAFRTAQVAAAQLTQGNRDLQEVQRIADRVETIEINLEKLNAQALDCVDPTSPACLSIQTQIDDLLSEKKQLNSELASIRGRIRDEYRDFMRAREVAKARKEEWLEADSNFQRIETLLVNARRLLHEMYSDLGLLEGGYVTLSYDTGWDENIENLRKANRDFNIEKIPTAHAAIQANFIASNNRGTYLQTLPAVLDYSVNGFPYVPGETAKENLLPAMPSKMSATLRLSLIGACPILKPDEFEIQKDQAGVPTFSIAASFDYPIAFQTKVSFSYNLYQFYKHIERRGSKGGFFSRKSWAETIEEKNGDDSFTTHWEESDPDNLIPEEQKREIEKQVKIELTERVLRLLAVGSYDPKLQLQNPPPVPPAGATVLGNGLMRTCGGFNIWCSGGAFILKGLGSIFGRSSSESTVMMNYNVTTREEWSRETVRYKPSVTVFVR